MSDYIEDLVERYKSLGVIVDTNLLLLFFVGLYSPTKIETFNRTNKYQRTDFDILMGFLANFDAFYTTPNILTEVSNLTGKLGKDPADFRATIFSSKIKVFEEVYIPSRDVAGSDNFAKLGLTDGGIIQIQRAKGRFLLLTDDFDLYYRYCAAGGDALNLTQLRPHGWKW